MSPAKTMVMTTGTIISKERSRDSFFMNYSIAPYRAALRKSVAAMGAVMVLFCQSCWAWAQDAETAASDGGFVQTLASHILTLQIICGAAVAVFVICLCWEVWVTVQLRQNGGVLPEPESQEEEKTEKESRFTPPVLDETEDPFKALLNKASSADEDKKEEESKATSSPSEFSETYKASGSTTGAKKFEPYKNIEPVKNSNDRITRRDKEVPSFDGNATIAVGAGFSGQRTGGFGHAPGGGIGFGTPPKPPAQSGAIGFGAPAKQQSIGFAPPKSPTSGVGFAPPKAPGAGVGFAPPKAPGAGVGFAPPKAPGAGVGFAPPKAPASGVGFAPPKSPTSGVGFAPPKAPGSGVGFAPPKAPGAGVGFAPPKSPSSAPASFAPPKHGGLAVGAGASAARPVAPPTGTARPSAPFGTGAGAARPANSGESWKALANGMEQKGAAHGGVRGQSLDIKRGGFPPAQTP